MEIRETGWDIIEWINLSQDRDHYNGRSGSGNCCGIREWLRDWWLLNKDSAPWS
jgi:hypothetical protein